MVSIDYFFFNHHGIKIAIHILFCHGLIYGKIDGKIPFFKEKWGIKNIKRSTVNLLKFPAGPGEMNWGNISIKAMGTIA